MQIAWELALVREDGPVALGLGRQDVPVLDLEAVTGARHGGYALWEPEAANGSPDLVLLATGSEMWPTLEAARTLEREDVCARVVSLPASSSSPPSRRSTARP